MWLGWAGPEPYSQSSWLSQGLPMSIILHFHQPQAVDGGPSPEAVPTRKALPAGPWMSWGWLHVALSVQSCKGGGSNFWLTYELFYFSRSVVFLIFLFATIPISTYSISFYLILVDRIECYFLSIEITTDLIFSIWFLKHIQKFLVSNKLR